MAKNIRIKKFLSLDYEIKRLAWLSKAQKVTISTSAGHGMSHYDFLPAERTNKFIVSMLEMLKSYFIKTSLWANYLLVRSLSLMIQRESQRETWRFM